MDDTHYISNGSDSLTCFSPHVTKHFITTASLTNAHHRNETGVDIITTRLVALQLDARIVVCKKLSPNSQRVLAYFEFGYMENQGKSERNRSAILNLLTRQDVPVTILPNVKGHYSFVHGHFQILSR